MFEQESTRRGFVKGAMLGAASASLAAGATLALADEAQGGRVTGKVAEGSGKEIIWYDGNPEVVPNGAPMNILVLNGSPHPEGNTMAMVNAFIEGAEEAGHTVSVVSTYEYVNKLSPCRGCMYCMGDGAGTCVQMDAFAEIRAQVEQADMIVIASPVQYFTISGPLQTVKSRFYAVWASGRHHVKKVALFLSSNIDEYYDGIIFAHLNAAEVLSLESMGVFTSYGAQNKSEEKLEELRAFGRSL